MFQMFINNNRIEVQISADVAPQMNGLNAFLDSMVQTKQADVAVVAKRVEKKRGRGITAWAKNKR